MLDLAVCDGRVKKIIHVVSLVPTVYLYVHETQIFVI